MTKLELIDRIVERLKKRGLVYLEADKMGVGQMADLVLNEIRQAFLNGEDVKIRDLGTFRVRVMKRKKVRDFQKKVTIDTDGNERVRVSFKVSRPLKLKITDRIKDIYLL